MDWIWAIDDGDRGPIWRVAVWTKKIQYLRDKEQHESLANVSQNAHHGKGHAGKVTTGIPHKDRSGIPIVTQQAQSDTDKG